MGKVCCYTSPIFSCPVGAIQRCCFCTTLTLPIKTVLFPFSTVSYLLSNRSVVREAVFFAPFASTIANSLAIAAVHTICGSMIEVMKKSHAPVGATG